MWLKRKHKERLIKDCQTLIDALHDVFSKDNLTHKNQIADSKILSSFTESILKSIYMPQLAGYYCEFCFRIGEISKALTLGEEVKNFIDKKVKDNPNNEDFKALLAVSYSSLAGAYYKQGEFAKAISYHKKNLNQLETLDKRKLEKFTTELIEFNLSTTKNRLGVLYRDLGDLMKASKLQLESLAHAELLSNNLRNYKKRKLEANKELGHINFQWGKKENNNNQRTLYFSEAKDYANEYHRLAKELNENNPNIIDYRDAVAGSYQLLVWIHKDLRNYDIAQKFIIAQNEESKSICEDYPNDIQLNINLAISHLNIGCFFKDCLNNKIEAKRQFEIAKSKFEEIQLKPGNQVNLQNKIDDINEILSKLCSK